jgi:hypothetical protein
MTPHVLTYSNHRNARFSEIDISLPSTHAFHALWVSIQEALARYPEANWFVLGKATTFFNVPKVLDVINYIASFESGDSKQKRKKMSVTSGVYLGLMEKSKVRLPGSDLAGLRTFSQQTLGIPLHSYQDRKLQFVSSSNGILLSRSLIIFLMSVEKSWMSSPPQPQSQPQSQPSLAYQVNNQGIYAFQHIHSNNADICLAAALHAANIDTCRGRQIASLADITTMDRAVNNWWCHSYQDKKSFDMSSLSIANTPPSSMIDLFHQHYSPYLPDSRN